jgi:hypothetical protein
VQGERHASYSGHVSPAAVRSRHPAAAAEVAAAACLPELSPPAYERLGGQGARVKARGSW